MSRDPEKFETGNLNYDSAKMLCQSCIIRNYALRKKGILSGSGEEAHGCAAMGMSDNPVELYGGDVEMKQLLEDRLRQRGCHNIGEIKEFDHLEGYGAGWYFTCPNPTKEAEND